MKSTRILLATAALGLAIAAPASADSIAYVKFGDVYLAATDGQYASKITSYGGYRTVSQADDGTLVAIGDDGVRHITRTGAVISTTDTWADRPVEPEDESVFSHYGGALDVDVSPDAKHFAFGTTKHYHDQSYGPGYGVSDIDRFTPINPYPFETEFWGQPEWVDNDTFLLSEGAGRQYHDDVAISRGGRHETWFTDPGYDKLLDGTISRDRRVLAFVGGSGREKLVVYRDDDAQLLGSVTPCAFFSESEYTSQMSSPTLSADGRTLVWQDYKGLVTATLPSLKNGCGTLTDGTHILPDGQQPDWGPLNAPGDPRTHTPDDGGDDTPPGDGGGQNPPPGNGGGGGGGGQQPGGTVVAKPAPGGTIPGGSRQAPAAAPLKLVVGGKAKLAAVRRKGLKVAVGVPAAGPVVATAKRGSAVVATGRAKAKAAGTVSVRLKLTKAGKRKLKRGKLTLTVTQGAAVGTATVTVR